MSSFPKKICKTCKKSFTPKSGINIYCNRKCFKKAYWQKEKIRELKNIKFPVFNCPVCKQIIKLDFDPIKRADMWLLFLCPGCNTLMINVSDWIVTNDTPREKIKK